jgi:hypothetical protein
MTGLKAKSVTQRRKESKERKENQKLFEGF